MSVTSNSTDAVDTIIDLLGGYSGWSLDAPEVYHNQEVAQKSKEKGREVP